MPFAHGGANSETTGIDAKGNSGDGADTLNAGAHCFEEGLAAYQRAKSGDPRPKLYARRSVLAKVHDCANGIIYHGNHALFRHQRPLDQRQKVVKMLKVEFLPRAFRFCGTL
jgi:hypothetical protein